MKKTLLFKKTQLVYIEDEDLSDIEDLLIDEGILYDDYDRALELLDQKGYHYVLHSKKVVRLMD